MKPQILVIDNNIKLFSDIKEFLRFKGYKVSFMASDEIRAHRELLQYSLIILAVLPSSRKMWNKVNKYPVPVLFITDQSSFENTEYVFADSNDYILEPFTPKQLLDRIQQVLQATTPDAVQQEDKIDEIHVGSLAIRPTTREICGGNRRISCPPKSFDLLCHFVKHPNQLFTREELIQTVWNGDHKVSPRTVDTHVIKLRRKIEEAGCKNIQIVTVPGKGYIFLIERISRTKSNQHRDVKTS